MESRPFDVGRLFFFEYHVFRQISGWLCQDKGDLWNVISLKSDS
jgi:hypothetical protein